MKLKSMKISRREMDEKTEPAELSEDEYPWGLRLHLDSDVLKRLGIDKLPALGRDYRLEAVACVREASESKTASGSNRSITLQIEKLALQSGPRSAVEAVEDGIKDAS